VLDDPRASHDDVERLVLCSGKLYYDIVGHDLHEEARTVAVARLEQLYPFPIDAVEALLGRYSRLREVVLGPGGAAEHGPVALDQAPARGSGAREQRREPPYVGRTWKASPSEGYPTATRSSRTASSAPRSAFAS
jgi:2-oxoglutarate dehydrogenase E1 component